MCTAVLLLLMTGNSENLQGALTKIRENYKGTSKKCFLSCNFTLYASLKSVCTVFVVTGVCRMYWMSSQVVKVVTLKYLHDCCLWLNHCGVRWNAGGWLSVNVQSDRCMSSCWLFLSGSGRFVMTVRKSSLYSDYSRSNYNHKTTAAWKKEELRESEM